MDLLHKLKIKFQFSWPEWLLRFSLRLGSPRLTALALAAIAHPLNGPASPKLQRGGAGEQRVLTIARSIFMDDVHALAAYSGKIQYITLHLKYFVMMWEHFNGSQESNQVTESNYHVADFSREGKKRYHAYLQALLPILARKLRLDAVFSGNFAYVAQQELARVCVEQRLPFIVLHNDGLDIFKDLKALYKNYQFIGNNVLFYNHRVQQALLHLPGLSEQNTQVVGIPRLDIYFRKAASVPEKKQIVLFSFYPPSYQSFLRGNTQRYPEVEQRAERFHRAAMQYALDHPDTTVTIKTKVAGFYLAYVENIRRRHFSQPIPNLKITNSADPYELVRHSSSVLSFNSTTLLEGLLAGKTIVTPYFGDLLPGQTWDYFSEHPALVNYAKTDQDLCTLLEHPEQHRRYTVEQRNAVLQHLMFIPDGRASQRVEQAIIQAITAARKITHHA